MKYAKLKTKIKCDKKYGGVQNFSDIKKIDDYILKYVFDNFTTNDIVIIDEDVVNYVNAEMGGAHKSARNIESQLKTVIKKHKAMDSAKYKKGFTKEKIVLIEVVNMIQKRNGEYLYYIKINGLHLTLEVSEEELEEMINI